MKNCLLILSSRYLICRGARDALSPHCDLPLSLVLMSFGLDFRRSLELFGESVGGGLAMTAAYHVG